MVKLLFSHVDVNDLIVVHAFLFGLLMSVYPCPGELQIMLTQSWVSTWNGWTEASAMIESPLTSHDENLIADEFVVRFFAHQHGQRGRAIYV